MSVRALILLDVLLVVLVGLDLYRTLSTGRAGRRSSPITRQHQPDKFWRYIYASCAVLALCGVALLWMGLSPGAFG
jgi:hypothetical protein